MPLTGDGRCHARKPSLVGSNFEDFLQEEGRLGQATALAIKSVLAWELRARDEGVECVAGQSMARRMKTSRAVVHRLLDANDPSVTLATIRKAATALGRSVRLALRLERASTRPMSPHRRGISRCGIVRTDLDGSCTSVHTSVRTMLDHHSNSDSGEKGIRLLAGPPWSDRNIRRQARPASSNPTVMTNRVLLRGSRLRSTPRAAATTRVGSTKR